MSQPAPDLNPPLAEPPVVVRPSRDGDVPAMLAIYLHHIRKGVDPNYDGEYDAPDTDDLSAAAKTCSAAGCRTSSPSRPAWC